MGGEGEMWEGKVRCGRGGGDVGWEEEMWDGRRRCGKGEGKEKVHGCFP